MPRPNKDRAKAIQSAEIALQKLSNSLQGEYFDSVWRAISPAVTMQVGGITAVAGADVFLVAWKRILGRGINKFIKTELLELEKQAAEYYKKYPSKTLSFSEVQKIVVNDLRRNLENFAKAYNDSTDVALRLRTFAITKIQQGLSSADIRGAIEDEVLGTETKLGIVDNYNFVKVRVQDVFSEYDRRLSNQYANQLGLNYFIYQGGEIKTTRPFCDQLNAKVFTREEGVEISQQDWEGKKPNNNFFTDCGGYNCRHYLDWISYELAVQLRPDIKKSVYDV